MLLGGGGLPCQQARAAGGLPACTGAVQQPLEVVELVTRLHYQLHALLGPARLLQTQTKCSIDGLVLKPIYYKKR